MKYQMVFMVLLTTACSSPQVKHVDTEVDSVKGNTSSGILALKDGNAIIQQEVMATDELKLAQWKNADQEQALRSYYEDLKECRNNLADARLGGNGEITPLPEIDNLKPIEAIKEEFGLNNNQDLVFVKKQVFLEKLANERKYGATLNQMVKVVEESKDACYRKQRVARVKAGLPGDKIRGQGHLDREGNWTITKEGEYNLDDAFNMSKKTQ